jgi:hypothetical protein
MFLFGEDFFGKIDAVPGLFYVRTQFFHIWWFPMLPQKSYLFLDEQPGFPRYRGIEIRLQWKSIWFAWLRSFLMIGLIGLIFSGVGLLVADLQTGMRHLGLVTQAIWAAALIVGWLYWLCDRFSPSTLNRATELGQLLGVPLEVVESRFHQIESAR